MRIIYLKYLKKKTITLFDSKTYLIKLTHPLLELLSEKAIQAVNSISSGPKQKTTVFDAYKH